MNEIETDRENNFCAETRNRREKSAYKEYYLEVK